MTHDVVVVGGGLVGSATAWRLAQRGREVLLLEAFEPGHVRGASHGASRIFRRTYPDRVYAALAAEAERGWRELEDTTGSTLLTTTGGVDHGDPALLRPFADGLAAAGEPAEWLEVTEARRRWPGLAFSGDVLFSERSGRVHADRAVAALQSAAVAAGAELRHTSRVDGLTVDDDGATIELAGNRLRTRHLVVAAGAWTADLLGGQLRLPSITVTQEQPVHLATDLPDEAWPSFVHHIEPGSTRFGGTWGLLTPGQGVKVGFHGVGPVVHPDRRDFLAEPEQLAALLAYARQWLPGADAESAEPISCTYASTDDGNFVLDRRGRVTVAAGFSGHGFKFGPATGRVLADLVDGVDAVPQFGLAATRARLAH